MLEMMDEMFPPEVHWTRPQGGMFLWGILPKYMDAADVLKIAIERKVAFVPGASFHACGGGANTISHNKAPGSAGGYLRVPSMFDSLEVQVLYLA